ncbi:MAG: TIR domain-containing protein [Candidatus Atabeyarchaeum deiterrae]
MQDKPKLLVKFSGLPDATSGFFLPGNNWLITGHQNGLVLRWDVEKGTSDLLYKCASEIETISGSGGKSIVIGTHAGELVVLDLENPKNAEVIQKATYDKHSRIWRTVWPTKGGIVFTSTYGVMNAVSRTMEGRWENVPLSGHSDSIFGLGNFDGTLLASGDYRGNILIWKSEAGRYAVIQTLKVNQVIQGISWHKDRSFAVIGQAGRIYLYEETESNTQQWQLIVEVSNASSYGRCVHITDDGKTVFAGTDNELIQFDIDSQQVGSIDIAGARTLFSKGDTIYVLTGNAFESFQKKKIEVKVGFIRYRYAKISLIGQTGVGKSTLCNFIITGSPGDLKSTFGRRVWNWSILGDESLERRIIFYDHGGQETVLGTFLPFITDSDLILIVFQQNDKGTFRTALRTLDQIKTSLAPKTKIFFVQTHIDHRMNEIDESYVKSLVDSGQINGHFKVCPSDGSGVEELKSRLAKEISWVDARIMIQSQSVDGVIKTISSLQDRNVNTIRFEFFRKAYGQLGLNISAKHLEFLLRDLSDQGMIDYYPKVSDLIIISDEKYNELRTQIPIFVDQHNGIVSFDDLLAAFGHHEYLPILDLVYQSYGVSIKDQNLRVFPEKLKSEIITIPEKYSHLLKGSQPRVVSTPPRKIEVARLIAALSELNLRCIDASQSDGLFSWEENACVYYRFQRFGDAMQGEVVRWTYFIAGAKKQTCERLEGEFQSIVEKLYGPFVATSQNNLKKKPLKKEIRFDVALSFAGEQRDYVRQVDEILEGKGVKTFFAEFYTHQLWGTNLAEYLNDVFYSQSNYCMMFVSKEYIEKAWPTHERRSAIARQIKQFGNYILPVIFDDSEVPGFQLSSIGYLDARKMSPSDVANQFVKKLEASQGS